MCAQFTCFFFALFHFVFLFFVRRKEGWTLIDFSGHIHSAQVTPCILYEAKKATKKFPEINSVFYGWINVRLRSYLFCLFFRFSFFIRRSRWSAWMTLELEMFNLSAFINPSIRFEWQLVSETKWITRNIDLFRWHMGVFVHRIYNKVHWTKL